MYCVRRGLVEVIGDDDITVVATLGPGTHFGEVKNDFFALLPSYTYNCNILIIIIIYKQQFLHSDWLRACQLIPKQCKN